MTMQESRVQAEPRCVGGGTPLGLCTYCFTRWASVLLCKLFKGALLPASWTEWIWSRCSIRTTAIHTSRMRIRFGLARYGEKVQRGADVLAVIVRTKAVDMA